LSRGGASSSLQHHAQPPPPPFQAPHWPLSQVPPPIPQGPPPLAPPSMMPLAATAVHGGVQPPTTASRLHESMIQNPQMPQGPPPQAPPSVSAAAAAAPHHLSSSRSTAMAAAVSTTSTSTSTLSQEERRREELLYCTTPEAERAAREKYGLMGVLKVIQMTDPDLNTLALGMDLTTLGLNLNSSDTLYATFGSPFSVTPMRKDPEFHLPPCYYAHPRQLKTTHLEKFTIETLFYIFFNMPQDMLQACAAAELYNRGWKYHADLKTWFDRKQDERGQTQWIRFDSTMWERHYYLNELDPSGFLAEDDVRVQMPFTGGASTTNASAG